MTTRLRVLFVDDDPRVLRGLRRQLESMTDEALMMAFHAMFAESGEAALDIITRQPCDLLITDIRMPGMDGVTLLKEVQRISPHTIRMILSGYSDHGAYLFTTGLAHQYLAKPCNLTALKQVLNRAIFLHRLLDNEGLKKLISSMKTLPSLPETYYRLLKELQSSNSSVKQVGQVIAEDAGMTAKILQAVNSAFFGLSQRIVDPTQAVLLLGLDTIKALVISVHIFAQFEQPNARGLTVGNLQTHHLTVAMLARHIAEWQQLDRSALDAAVTAGLLHDIGKLVLAANLPEQYRRVQLWAEKRNITVYQAEGHIFTATHAEVGAYLAGLWGLPDPIVEALAYHHQPGLGGNARLSPLTAVHLADCWAHQANRRNDQQAIPEPDLAYLAQLGLLDRLPEWQADCLALLKFNGAE